MVKSIPEHHIACVASRKNMIKAIRKIDSFRTHHKEKIIRLIFFRQ